jgi:hypothetical protein
MVEGFFPVYSPVVEVFPALTLVNKATDTCYMSSVFNNSVIQAADVRLMFRGNVVGTPVVGATFDIYLATGHTIGSNVLTDTYSTTTPAGNSVSAPRYSRHLVSLQVPNESSAYFSWEASLLEYIGAMPLIWSIILCNRTGVPTSGYTQYNTFTAGFVNYGYA